jgi:hypothetical protein
LEGAVSEFCGTEHHVLCSGCPCACHKDGSGPSGASEDWPEEFKKLKKLLLGEEAVDAAAARSFEYYEEGSWDEAQGWERTVWRRNALADLIAAWNAATGHSFSLPDDSAPEQPGSQGEGGR